MSVSTLQNFIAAINAAVGAKSGATYYVGPAVYADGDLTVYQQPKGGGTGVAYAHIWYSQNPNWGCPTDINPTGAGIMVKMFINAGTGSGTPLSDSVRYKDAQGFINELLAS